MLDKTGNQAPVWIDETTCSIDDFKRHLEQKTEAADYPAAEEIVFNIPVYNGKTLLQSTASETGWRAVMAEWNRSFATGPGIIVIRKGYTDLALIDEVTGVLNRIMQDEQQLKAGKGDHFAAAGANTRIWNAHEKLCVEETELFIRYNANELLRRASEAWLGPRYQITCQVNVVHPGGKAQVAHRDYHMGFQDAALLQGYPAPQHALSPLLTLQGAIAHSDMPVISGPTKLLPFSQSYLPGYQAVLLPEFRDCFEERNVQVPLEKGDLLFFNPATFHAAGDNKTRDVERFANLLQIGSAYGRSIEIVDRLRMSLAVYPVLAELQAAGRLDARSIDTVVAATAEGYPFPANLDIDSPLSGMAPPSQQDLMRTALKEGWTAGDFASEIEAQAARKRSH
ncbi:phytanoyl-CoA dioxygenase family protein [Roseibium sp. MMSF_3544]|uniref:phytanoyl-CoA dioxygenase family protein n=1 Tax=unclassified Roseibium TaxID=2629323 RepID=UPI00273EC54A|nr:phytanoyl-CoA dioxygenase family protein [Roseibium sp. MMSF_3544]